MPKFPISIGSVAYEKVAENNYFVNVSFTKGGSAQYFMNKDQIQEFEDNPSGSFYNDNIRIKEEPF